MRMNRQSIALFAALALVLGVQAAEDADRASVGYSESGVLYLTTDSGRLLRTVKSTLPIRDFAVSPDGKYVVFGAVDGTAYGGPLYLLTLASGTVRELTRGSKNRSVVYSDPEFSPDGSRVVLAIHASAHGDLVEAAGPIGVLVLETGQLSVLSATAKIDGDGPAFSNEPHWAPNSFSVLFSFETGAAEVNAKGGKLRELTSLMEGTGDSWSHAVGWLGSKCVVYIAGKDQKDADRKPARVLNLITGTTLPAAQLLGATEDSMVGLTAFSPALWIRSVNNRVIATSKRGMWDIPVHSPRAVVRLVPYRGPSDDLIPQACQ